MPMTHIDFTNPFDESVRQAILDAAQSAKIFVHNRGTYACTQGPRLETAAEVRRIDHGRLRHGWDDGDA